MNEPANIAESSAEDEALSWLVDFDNLSREEQARFTAWLNERPENGRAFEKMERQWRELDVLQQLATETPDVDVVGKWLRKRRLRRQRRFLPAAAAAVAALGVIVWMWFPTDYEAHYRTAIGEHREIVLPDDSLVKLNTNSSAVVRYSDEERRVYLERGEAHFDVVPAPERPFSVVAGAGTVRAVGTAFNVYLKDDVVEVTVTKGIVEVLPNAPAAGGQRTPNAAATDAAPMAETLVEGHKIEYREAIESISNVAPEELARKLAWQDGMLDFEGETLVNVIREASRYTSVRITIENPELENLHVSGYFKAGDVDTLLELIESNDRVAVRRLGPQFVQLTANPLRHR